MANTKVYGEQIVDGSITAAKLADGTIVAAELANNAVETAAINADAVTGAKIADDAIDSEHYVDGSIDTAHIGNDQVTQAKIADDAVGADQLAASAVVTASIVDDNVTTAKIADGNISTALLADTAVTSAKLANNIDIAGTFDVTGATTLDSTLTVKGATVFNEDSADVDFRIESNGSTHMFFVDAGNNTILMSSNPASDTQSTPHDILTLAVAYADSSGTNGAAGLGPRIAFKIPDDEDNPSLGGGIAVVKESADDSVSNAAMTFSVSQNDETLDEMWRIESGGKFYGTGQIQGGTVIMGGSTLTYAGDSYSAIGTNSTSARLGFFRDFSTSYPTLIFNTSDDAHFAPHDADMRVYLGSQGGDFGGNSSNNLRPVGTAFYQNSGGGNFVFERAGTGAGYIDAGGFNDGSDEALKKDIADITYGLDTVKSLKPRKFKWKSNSEDSIGFIAQEVESIIPEVVSESNVSGTPTSFKGLSYGHLTAVLVKAIQELSAELEAAKARIKTLEDS